MRSVAPRLLLLLLLSLILVMAAGEPTPVPVPWPERFHALLYSNLSERGQLLVSDMWYDWAAGRNAYLRQEQLGPLMHSVEWNNGTSYYYTLGSPGAGGTCRTVLFGVGIPRRDFMDGATYLGRRHTEGFLCDVWEKTDFIRYYEDVATRVPVRWDFHDAGISTYVMTFEVDAVLDESQWQAPSYCFNKEANDEQKRANMARKGWI